MTTVLAKNRAIRLQQELVPMLGATGSFEGANDSGVEWIFANG